MWPVIRRTNRNVPSARDSVFSTRPANANVRKTLLIGLYALKQRQHGRHFVDAFFSVKTFKFRWKCHWFFSMGSNWDQVINGPCNGLAPNRRQAIIRSSGSLANWCIYASLGLNDLTHCVVRTIDIFLFVISEQGRDVKLRLLKSAIIRLFVQQRVQLTEKKTSKLRITATGYARGESTGHRWIFPLNGQ